MGSAVERDKWVLSKAAEWAECVRILASVAKRYPQSAYACFVTCLQAEWQYVARTIPDLGALFDEVERAIRNSFLPALLGVEAVTAEQQAVMSQGVKQAGLVIRNPVDCAELNYGVSKRAVEVLVKSMVNGTRLFLAEHRSKVRVSSTWGRGERVCSEEAANTRQANKLGLREKHRLQRACNSGIWSSVLPNRFNGTVVSAEEFWDNLHLRYNLMPLDLPEKCDGCGAGFSVEHALSCKVGGLVHIRHDDVAQEDGWVENMAREILICHMQLR
jgi:hypothetical protein